MGDLSIGLRDYGIKLKNFTLGQHRTLCPKCSHTRKKRNDPCLSVLVEDTGATWTCHNCNWSDGFSTTRGEAKRERVSYRKPEPPRRVGAESEHEHMLKWFASRAIGAETIAAFGVHLSRAWFPQVQEERDCIAFPYRVGGELRNVKYRARVKLEDVSTSKMFAQEKGAERTLYNADEIQADELVIVEGEMDVLACWEAGIRSVVSLPDGAGKTVEANGEKRLAALEPHAEHLAKVARVVIATDGDEAGQALAEALALRFGKDRCSRVTWPEGVKDANEVLVRDGKDAVLALIAGARPWPMDGVFDVDAFEAEVLDLFHNRVRRPLSTGIDVLDPHFRVVPGTFVVVSGIPNHGKSSFVDQLVVNLGDRHGWRTAIFSPEHSPARHVARLAEKVIRMPFDVGPSPRMSERHVHEAIGWLRERVKFVASKDAVPTLDWLLERFRHCAIRHGINAIVIDPWNEVESSRARDVTETEFIGQAIQKLKRFAIAHEVTVFCVVHPAKLKRDADGREPVPTLYDLAGSAHWRNKADAGLVIHRDFDSERTEVWIRKIREQPAHGELGRVLLRFDPRTRCYEGADLSGDEETVVPFHRGGDAA